MKVLQSLILVLVICAFCSKINAQADCGFDFRLYVRDTKGKLINNVQVKMNFVDFYRNSQTGAFVAWTLLSVGSKYKGLLKVNANGFDKFEKEVEIKCGFYSYDLRLKANGAGKAAIFEELAIIEGIVKDTNGAVIPNAKVILTDEKGKRTETFTNENGYYDFVIQSGKYSLEFIGTSGFEPKKYKDFELFKGYKNFDVVLEVRPCDDCEMIEDTPIKENKKSK